MGKIQSFRPRKRKFYGNRNTSVADTAHSNLTASAFKLQQCNELSSEHDNQSETLSGNRMIDIQILFVVFAALILACF
ncbi:unnamed protein product [Larinioides sclopetarius]|uniref:Uncharacterized protein n=1 Tax=Larinioides sclopetarius TaxID=280406 RepID=A0AAV1ZN15_9ARAC